MKKLRLTALVALMLVSALQSIAATTDRDPNGYDWGSNPKEAKGKWMNLDRTYQAQAWDEAVEPTNWLLQNAPALHLTLYIRAEKIYKEVIKAEKDKDHLKILQDSLLTIYDLRIENFGEKAKVLDKKGKKAYIYWYKDKSKLDELYNLYKEIVDLNQLETDSKNLVFYFKTVGRKVAYKKMTEEQLLAEYEMVTGMLKKQRETEDAKGQEKIDGYLEDVDKTLTSYVTMDCDFVTSFYGPKYEKNKTLELAKKISDQMIKNKCVSNELFVTSTNHVLKEDPDYGRYKLLAKVYENMDKKDSAYVNYERAIALAPHDTVKAPLYLAMAKINGSKGQKAAARADARLALGADPGLSEAHLFIGNLYFNSFGSCQTGDVIKDRAVYIAAYNEYKKAGASSKMAAAKGQFPSLEELFNRSKKVGDSETVGCWINETVTLQKRD